jgi:hypothetical protein
MKPSPFDISCLGRKRVAGVTVFGFSIATPLNLFLTCLLHTRKANKDYFLFPSCSYQLDINVDKSADVLVHQKVLMEAKDPLRRPAFRVRFLRVKLLLMLVGVFFYRQLISVMTQLYLYWPVDACWILTSTYI